MKTLTLILSVLLFAGCAQFRTVQTDYSYDEKGSPQRKVTTRATATTFLDGKSALANFKASQTDKTQGASVGSLNQESQSNTNGASTIRAITELLNAVK